MAQALPRSAERYATDQRRIIAATVAEVSRLWRRMGTDFDASWATIESSVLAAMDRAQYDITAGALAYIPDVLAETGQRVGDLTYDIPTATLVGTAGDGFGTDSLAYEAVIGAKTAVANGSSSTGALLQAGRFLSVAMGTALSDTGRTAEKMAGHSRGVGGYVRMLEPPSCGRCVILAGKRSRSSVAFLRHPKCDCRNIPAAESVAGDLTVDPHEYLDGLSDEQLARTLGSRANAQAWRDGADPNQLINAYRRGGDVRTAQSYSGKVRYTTEGMTRRGIAHRAMRRAGYARKQDDVRLGGGRYFRARTPRLMPETIYRIATDRADAVRLLRLYGWLGY